MSTSPISSFGKDFLAPADGEWEKGERAGAGAGEAVGRAACPLLPTSPSREDEHESTPSKSKA